MSVWRDEALREPARPGPADAPGGHGPVMRPRARTEADVRLAAERDAADIIARARRDIRRIVAEARRELLELSAQLDAAAAAAQGEAKPIAAPPASPPPASSAPPPTATVSAPVPGPVMAPPPIDADIYPDLAAQEEAAAETPAPRPAAAPTPPPATGPVFDTRYTAADLPRPIPETRSPARTFVALFTLAGLIAVIGTALWLMRRPPAPAAPAAAPPSRTAAPAPDTRPAPSRAQAPPASPSPTSPTPPPAAGLTLALEARRPTWVRVVVDGQPDVGHTYAEGERREIRGASEVSIRAGDAGGLLLSVNGGAAAPFGRDGIAVTRRFSKTPAAPPAAPVPPPDPEPPAEEPVPGQPPAAQPRTLPPPIAAAPPATAPPPRAAAAPAPGRATAPPRVDVAAASRQWLDAYHRQDRGDIEALSAPSLNLNDERRATERFPFGLEVTRAFEDEQLTLSGDTAQFNARMIERASTGAFAAHVTLTWVRRSGEWQLQEARLARDEQAAPR